MSDFTTFLADCWRMFEEVQVPVLNISFAKLYLGVFVVGISIIILRPLLGIGGRGFASNIFHGLTGSGKRGYDNAYSRNHKSSNEWSGTKVVARNNNVHIRHSKPPEGFK